MLTKVMTEEEMQQYANEKEGYEVEFLPEYALKLGYEATLEEDSIGEEYYIFNKIK